MKKTKTTKLLDKETLALLTRLIKETSEIQISLEKCFQESAKLLAEYSSLDKEEIDDRWTDCFYNGQNLKNTLKKLDIKLIKK